MYTYYKCEYKYDSIIDTTTSMNIDISANLYINIPRNIPINSHMPSTPTWKCHSQMFSRLCLRGGADPNGQELGNALGFSDVSW